MSNEGQNREPLSIGEPVAGVEVTEKLGGGGGIHAWSAQHPDGKAAVVFALDAALGRMARDKFLSVASETIGPAAEGILSITHVDPSAGAYVADLDATGTLADLPILSWEEKRRVKLVRRICEIVAGLHARGTVHGWLRPENILLDSDFEPVVANTRVLDIGALCRTDASMVWTHRVYMPPEVRHGQSPDERSDTYALGRILHFALAGEEADEKDERLPRLDALLGKKVPNALVRIVRKCTALDPGDRYDSAAEIVNELDRVSRHVPVGMPHPEIDGAEESSMVDDDRMRSKPPPRREKTARSSIAIELHDNKSGGAQFWSIGIAVGLGFLGLLMLGIPMMLAFYMGMDATALNIIVWAAAIPIGLATPGFTDNRLLTRVLAVLVVGAILVFAAPIDKLSAARTAGLESGNLDERVAAFKALIEAGETDFRASPALDLSGADLTGMDLSKLQLAGVVFKGTNLSNVKFRETEMVNVDLSNANISGASLGDVPGAYLKGLASATCDTNTTMPYGYVCKDGSPLPTPR